MKTAPPAIEIEPEAARAFLVGHLGLARYRPERGAAAGIRAMLGALRAVQLDPLDAIGTNADLVAMARVRGVRRGDVYASLLPGHAFEHFAKERCLLPPDAFPHYRERGVETWWWRTAERLRRVPPAVLDRVRAEVRARGPVAAGELEDGGRVEALDWAGWKGTSSAVRMALEILWTRCEVVVAGRRGREKVYDVPERALPVHHDAQADGDFARWAVARARGGGGTPRRDDGRGVVDAPGRPANGCRRDAPRRGRHRAGARARPPGDVPGTGGVPRPPGRPARRRRCASSGRSIRCCGIARSSGTCSTSTTCWEVYKPPAVRRWGWYVCPLLHRGRLVGRIDARIDGDALVVRRALPRARGAARCGGPRRLSRAARTGVRGATGASPRRQVAGARRARSHSTTRGSSETTMIPRITVSKCSWTIGMRPKK